MKMIVTLSFACATTCFAGDDSDIFGPPSNALSNSAEEMLSVFHKCETIIASDKRIDPIRSKLPFPVSVATLEQRAKAAQDAQNAVANKLPTNEPGNSFWR